jgi:hypothetical protein
VRMRSQSLGIIGYHWVCYIVIICYNMLQ